MRIIWYSKLIGNIKTELFCLMLFCFVFSIHIYLTIPEFKVHIHKSRKLFIWTYIFLFLLLLREESIVCSKTGEESKINWSWGWRGWLLTVEWELSRLWQHCRSCEWTRNKPWNQWFRSLGKTEIPWSMCSQSTKMSKPNPQWIAL